VRFCNTELGCYDQKQQPFTAPGDPGASPPGPPAEPWSRRRARGKCYPCTWSTCHPCTWLNRGRGVAIGSVSPAAISREGVPTWGEEANCASALRPLPPAEASAARAICCLGSGSGIGATARSRGA
jgi:hypothetical protein